MKIDLRQINRCDFVVILYILLNLQDVLYPAGLITKAISIIIISFSFGYGYMYMLPFPGKPLLLKASSLFLLLFIVYGVASVLIGDLERPLSYWVQYLYSYAPIFLFYRFAKEGYLTEDRIRTYFFCIFLVTIVCYFRLQNSILTDYQNKGLDISETTNNVGYNFCRLIPLTFFFHRKVWVQYLFIGLIMLFVLSAMKRGAILISAICLVWLLIKTVRTAKTIKQRYLSWFLGAAIVIGGVFFVHHQLLTSDYFNERIEETKAGNVSNRDKIYGKVIERLETDTSVFHLLLGYGMHSNGHGGECVAHQDWLQTANDYGLLGMALFFFYLFAYFWSAKSSKDRLIVPYSTAFMMQFVIFFIASLFSMAIEEQSIILTMQIGYFTYQSNVHEESSLA